MGTVDATALVGNIFAKEKAECVGCPDNTFQDQDGTMDLECKDQPVCIEGTHIKNLGPETQATCEPCEPGHYQRSNSHREPKCILRKSTTCESYEWRDVAEAADPSSPAPCQQKTKCTRGKFLSGAANGDAPGECTSCPAGQYETAEMHRHEECTKHGACRAGNYLTYEGDGFVREMVDALGGEASGMLEGPFGRAKAECRPCETGTFQSMTNHKEKDCQPWNYCGVSEFLENPNPTTNAGVCKACEAGKHMDDDHHQELTCHTTGQGQPPPGRAGKNKNALAVRPRASFCRPTGSALA